MFSSFVFRRSSKLLQPYIIRSLAVSMTCEVFFLYMVHAKKAGGLTAAGFLTIIN